MFLENWHAQEQMNAVYYSLFSLAQHSFWLRLQ